MYCGKCGAIIPDGYEFCMKCGTKIETPNEETAENSIVEAEPVKKGIKKKVLIPVIAVIVVALASIVIIFGTRNNVEKNGYFANIPWGTDIETVQKDVEQFFNCESSIEEDENLVIASIENYEGMQGVKASPILYCDDDGKLNKVSIVFTRDDNSEYTGDKIADRLIEKYNKLFNTADKSEKYTHKWVTENSTIKLFKLTEDFMMLQFEK